MKFRTPYTKHVRVGFVTKGESRTKSDMAPQCDVNNIMAKYARTGLVDHVARHQGQYGDFSEIDFHTAMNTVIEAEEMFLTLPAKVRAEFNNDPGAFLTFMDDPSNEDKARELGLLPAKRADNENPAKPDSPPKADPPPAKPAAAPAGQADPA